MNFCWKCESKMRNLTFICLGESLLRYVITFCDAFRNVDIVEPFNYSALLTYKLTKINLKKI